MKKFFMKLGKIFLFFLFPLFVFFYYLPLPALYAKYLIAKSFSSLKIEKATFILPLYNNIFRDGISYVDLSITPFSKNIIFSNIESKNLLLGYQGIFIDFNNGFGTLKGNLDILKIFYKASGKEASLYIKGNVYPKRKYLDIKGLLKVKSLKFPIKYRGSFDTLLKNIK